MEDKCGATINQNNTRIQSVGFPNNVATVPSSCAYTIRKCSSDVSIR